ncbi:hypothetical protein COCOBI_03-3040 [Coccomyxa sp. Obi]|nr:hypothetical protein COCOBI_03-3040 [Coccomyxa sp. Obi]
MASHARRGADTATKFVLLGVALLVQCCHGQQQQAADQQSAAVSFLAPRQATPLPLQGLSAGAPQGRAKDAVSPIERGDATWGTYLTSTSTDGLGNGPTKGRATISLSGPDTLSFNVTLNRAFDPSDLLQSILLSVPAFINSSAVTLAQLYGPNVTNVQMKPASWANGTGVIITGTAVPVVPFPSVVSNLSAGHAVFNLYTQNFPEPAEPMGCCNNAELKSEGSLEPLNAAALPVGGLRQDHHGTEQMPVTPGEALPFHATLTPFAPGINTTGGGVISLLVAPDNSSITYNVTLGGLAPGNEIYNVSVWFQIGRTRQLGWFPYSLYSFASNRLPTPKGGLIVPVDGANFTLATGWVGRFIDTSPTRALSTSAAKFTFNDPTYDFGVQQLLKGNVYIVIGTSDHPQGELQGHAVLGWPAQPA